MMDPDTRASIETAAVLLFGPPRFPRFDCALCVYVGHIEREQGTGRPQDRYYCTADDDHGPRLVYRESVHDQHHSGGAVRAFEQQQAIGFITPDLRAIVALLVDFDLFRP